MEDGPRLLLPVLLAVFGSLCLSCGDPLTEGQYRGQPLYQFTGQVTSLGGSLDSTGLRAAIFWSVDGSTNLAGELVEHDGVSVAVRFPGIFEINVFAPPPDVAWEDPTAKYRVGLVLIYADVNGDGRAQLVDPDTGAEIELRGGASHQVLVYPPEPPAAGHSPTGVALAEGYHSERVPMACELAELHPAGGCGVPIGDACADDAACGEGRCLKQDQSLSYPGGYCIQATGGACVPGGARALVTHVDGVPGTWFHKVCEDTDDCRLAEGYQCEGGFCKPGDAAALAIGPAFSMSRLCAEEPHDEDEEHEDDEEGQPPG